ncbi:hypothetical protein NHX12_033459 [Muraenolepis orangiensis]|uniref:Rab-GAP TBC domain-containing protein n=1 Tax=Muraenolepis orangiensis TaxID=630683 RepID=A0A9Q0II00_9TELE|nr:hypothetical protein NHX12_033459 [Muraenolepis orangiensis]
MNGLTRGLEESAQDGVITRDIHRTFPAHDYFKDSDGDGQDSLYKICKAYSVYDEEIGYCQGQSFLAAVLLLHMPEEQAFCVLVKIMYEYGLRSLYKNNFEDLHCKFYKLEKLMQEQLPDLWAHFQKLSLEAHMYASQWFLTLFTAKFPLCMVFHITDLLLSEGLNIIFNVALALLKPSCSLVNKALVFRTNSRRPLSVLLSSLASSPVGPAGSRTSCRDPIRAVVLRLWRYRANDRSLDSDDGPHLLLSLAQNYNPQNSPGPSDDMLEPTAATLAQARDPLPSSTSTSPCPTPPSSSPPRTTPSLLPPAVRQGLEDGGGKAEEEGAEGGQAESVCRVMGLLGMGHRLFVPKLLATSKEDLLQADFEGALKFFRYIFILIT